MSTRWGVYNLQGKDPTGAHVEADDARAVRWFVRWRVNGAAHKRTFKKKGYARTFHKSLTAAEFSGWPADERGWPVNPSAVSVSPPTPVPAPVAALTFEAYCHDVWWPIHDPGFGDKNRSGHRRNMEVAIDLLRYGPGDTRLDRHTRSGQSIRLDHLRADDCKQAVVRRSRINGRTAAVNARRVAKADPGSAVTLEEESASPATLRAFFVTLNMIIASAKASNHVTSDPMHGVSKMAPKPRPRRITQRLVPSVDEVFALSEAIAQIGPLMDNGRPTGDRFRALILVAGTAGPRPGELVAHQPAWMDWSGTGTITFAQTEAAVYDRKAGVSGRRTRPLKHREEGETRPVPLLAAVKTALLDHFVQGYTLPGRTWTAPGGVTPLDWSAITDTYWRAACRAVFSGTEKESLIDMPPKTLRSAAITFWLDSGISPLLAAEWAGHSEDVSKRYYAGRASIGFEKEAQRLADNFRG